MSRIIKRIYLENFKLFESLKIEFTNHLNVLDGKNGYGKTSVFDAIELLVTGKIKRIQESNLSNNNLRFEDNVIAKDSVKDVVVKGEFCDKSDGSTLIIAKKICGSVKPYKSQYNPSNMERITTTHILQSFDESLTEENEIKDWKSCTEKYFGKNAVSMYDLIYYVKQEERLGYFKKNDSEKSSSFDSILSMDDYVEKLEKGKLALRRLNELVKQKNKIIADNDLKICKPLNVDGINTIKYSRMFKKILDFDSDNIEFESNGNYNDMLMEIEKIIFVVKHKSDIVKNLIDIDMKKFFMLPKAQILNELDNFLLYNNIKGNTQYYEKLREEFKYFCDILGDAQYLKYESINFTKLKEYKYFDDNIIDDIIAKIGTYKEYMKNSKKSEMSIVEMIKAREQIKKIIETGVNLGGTCVLCGHNWNELNSLSIQIKSAEFEIENMKKSFGETGTLYLNEIHELFNMHLRARLRERVDLAKNDKSYREYSRLFSENTETIYNKIKLFLDNLNLDISQFLYNKSILEVHGDLLGGYMTSTKLVYSDEEYMIKNGNIDAINTYKYYFSDEDELNEISVDQILEKREYVHFQYYKYNNKLVKENRKIEEEVEYLNNTEKELLGKYNSNLEESLKAYRKNVVSGIKIPLFIYSARIMQSYQSGEGIKIHTKDDRTGQFRLVCSNNSHDIYNTMSSGQLSAASISFSLALNKVFSNNKFEMVLIDDPIQNMDEINIVSFIDMLKVEFPNTQVIISTHDSTFASYIKYKYEISGLDVKSIKMQEKFSAKLHN